MKTEPSIREDNTVIGFDISLTFISMRLIMALLRSVPGVSRVRRNFMSEDRIEFYYNGVRCTVNEPWGDNSHYWISPENVVENPIDMSPVHQAFASYSGWLIAAEWIAWVTVCVAVVVLVRAFL